MRTQLTEDTDILKHNLSDVRPLLQLTLCRILNPKRTLLLQGLTYPYRFKLLLLYYSNAVRIRLQLQLNPDNKQELLRHGFIFLR